MHLEVLSSERGNQISVVAAIPTSQLLDHLEHDVLCIVAHALPVGMGGRDIGCSVEEYKKSCRTQES